MSDIPTFDQAAFAMEYRLRLTNERMQQWFDTVSTTIQATSAREYVSQVAAMYKTFRANDEKTQVKELSEAWGVSKRRVREMRQKPEPKPQPTPEPTPVPVTVTRPPCIKNGSVQCEVCASRPKDGSLAEAEAMYGAYERFVKAQLWKEIRKYIKVDSVQGAGKYVKFDDLENECWHAVAFEIAKYKPQLDDSGKAITPLSWLDQIVYWTVKTHFNKEWSKPTVQLKTNGNRGISDGSWGYDARVKPKGSKPLDTSKVRLDDTGIPFLT